ncbi:hypothetical protein [Thiocystis violacea]|uniref:hypothetical protein n=1 Tax=Thiocystis violacea TaxID=13725 RepID=UPI001907B6EA|nr:hypothetical protein [Thiocystis violacea]MBK1723701.1 hypothetical protein [Thiocystis violacea]
MSRPGFAEGVVVALIAALGATIVQAGLGLFLPRADLAQVLCIGLGLGYGLYLMGRSGERVGRVVLVVAWVAISLFVGALFAGLWPQILTQLALVWLTRTLYYHAAPTAALLDAGLLLLGCAAAVWALQRTGSPFLMVWTLLLVQALFTMIPTGVGSVAGERQAPDPFASAERAAERALRRLSARR